MNWIFMRSDLPSYKSDWTDVPFDDVIEEGIGSRDNIRLSPVQDLLLDERGYRPESGVHHQLATDRCHFLAPSTTGETERGANTEQVHAVDSQPEFRILLSPASPCSGSSAL
jgi:hypothetical protein